MLSNATETKNSWCVTVYRHAHWLHLNCSTFPSHSVSFHPLFAWSCESLSCFSHSLFCLLIVVELYLSSSIFLTLSVSFLCLALPLFFSFFITAQVLSTRQSVTCSLGKEASWLWFVFLLRCGAVQSDRRLTATAPMMYLAEFQNIGRHVRVRVVSVATSQQGLPREGGAAAEEKEKEGN